MTNGKIIVERFDFAQGKRYLSELMTLVTDNFLEEGGEIRRCRPAFAVGCEMRPVVMQAIRRENR